MDFINTVTTSDGRPVLAQQRQRKQRSDKGKPRGPRRNQVAAAPSTMSAAVAAPVSLSTPPPATAALP